MTSSDSAARQEDGHLWAVAFGLSLLVNAGILGLAGFSILKSQTLRKSQPELISSPQATETTVTIFPEVSAGSPAETAPVQPRFVRTSEDQTAFVPEKTPFIGERNTQASSDRNPNASAPALPSQAGIDRVDLETTESRYQDGTMAGELPAMPQETPPAAPPTTTTPAKTAATDAAQSSPPTTDNLLSGTSPVDVPVPREPETKTEIKPATRAAVTPKPAAEPGFRGFQRKAAIVGSISRTGRSALDVADSPLGRYQAAISRAVEQEWQRNCVRHRDFITPGFLTVRFFIEPSGKVRTVRFVGDMETGEVQKGFTLNSIRNAEIPAMPAALRKDYEKEPLELIFNFYF